MSRDPAEQVEACLRACPLVAEAVALFAPQGARPWAVVRPDPAQLDAQRFGNVFEAVRFRVENAANALPVAWRPRGLTLARAPLPRTPAGTSDRAALAAALGERPPRALPRPGPGTPLPEAWLDWLRRVPALASHRGPLDRQTSLELDLGFDSLARLELLVAAADACGRPFRGDEPTCLRTLGDLADSLPAPSPGAEPVLTPAAVVEPRAADLAPVARRSPALTALVRAAVQPVVRGMLPLRVIGGGRVPWGTRPLLIAQNHQSMLDALLLAAALPPAEQRDVLFLGFTGHFSRGLGGRLASRLDIHPLSADDGALGGLRAAVAALRAGRTVVIYPEGERTWDGRLQPFRRGVAWIARAAGAAVVPAAIAGTYALWPRGGKLRFGPATIAFGPAVAPPGAGAGEDTFMARLRASIAGLLAEAGGDPEAGDPRTFASLACLAAGQPIASRDPESP